MKCPICGGELTPLDEKFVVCSTCGAKIPLDRVAPPATETPVSAPVEPPLDKTEDQKRLAELERRLAEMEEEKKQKEASAFGTKCKAAFSKVGNWVKGHKKATAFSVLGLLVVITIIVLCISLCGLRGIYVNEKNPYEYYEFGVSSYKCTMPLLDTEVTEEGTYKLSGDKITFTADTELFGTLSTDDDFKKLNGYTKIAIGMNNYFFVGYCLNSKVKITFDANGGEGGAKEKVQLGKMIKEAPTPTRLGYRFVGWEDSEGNAFVTGYPIWEKQTYYAKWKECNHSEMRCTDTACPTCQKEKKSISKEEQTLIQHGNLDENCVCSDCKAVRHTFNNNGECSRCGALQVTMSGTAVTGRKSYANGDLIIPKYATSIEKYAFYSWNDLTSVTIPDSMTWIGYYAFAGCHNLTSINFQGTKAQWNALLKGTDWDKNTGKYKIYCKDGILPK